MLTKNSLYRGAIALILAGIAMLCQPFAEAVYAWGFPVLLAGVVAFLILDHTPDWSTDQDET